MTETIVRSSAGLAQIVEARGHQVVVDEPLDAGGGDLGPTPYEVLLGALGACTAITVRLYAARHAWPLEGVEVRLEHDRVHAADCENCENPTASASVDRIRKRVVLSGPLSAEQRTRLLEIAERCPVQRTLQSAPVIESVGE